MNLPEPIATYVSRANSQDPDGVVACFRQDAIVHDEGQTRQGIAAIGEWAGEVSRKYRPTLEVLEVSEADGVTIVTGRVSGNFPGSPIVLRYRFTLDGTKIARLEIAI